MSELCFALGFYEESNPVVFMRKAWRGHSNLLKLSKISGS